MPKKKSSKSSKASTKQAVRRKEMKGKELLFVLLIVIIFGVIFVWHRGNSNVVNAPEKTPMPTPTKVTFICPNGDEIPASFDNTAGTVTFTLPGGEPTTLPHAMSADGARYANSDESLVFWNTGDSVMIEQNGVTTYQNCTTTQ